MLPWILFATALALLLLLVKYLSSPAFKGFLGEQQVKKQLCKNKLSKTLSVNDLLFISDGKSVQIDHVLINSQGLFVIETKNYSGRIYGSDAQLEWTQVLGRSKFKFYNPVKQNATHVFHLKKLLLPKKIPVHSVVVFVKNNTSYITSNSVIGISSLPEYLAKYRADILSESEIDELYDFFMDIKANTDITKHEHLKSVDELKQKLDNNICPRCGGNLLVRSGKYGDFFGCVNYPDCTFTKNFDV